MNNEADLAGSMALVLFGCIGIAIWAYVSCARFRTKVLRDATKQIEDDVNKEKAKRVCNGSKLRKANTNVAELEAKLQIATLTHEIKILELNKKIAELKQYK